MPVVEMSGIVKQYPGVMALDNVDFNLNKGEVHSLLGENGAGKTTLMKVLYGMVRPDSGTIKINGNQVDLKDPKIAIDLKIGMVHQHFMLVPAFTITENIVVGIEPKKGPFIDREKANKKVLEIIEKFNFNIDPYKKVKNISVGEAQKVEIVKTLYRGADILILDEPTAVLTPLEVEELFKILKSLQSQGKSIIIITHKLKETIEIADRVSILRDGKMVRTNINPKETTPNELANMMVGREVALGLKRECKSKGSTLVNIKNLNYKVKDKYLLKNIDLKIKPGEVLGIAGVEGNGQTELIECLTGLIKPDSMEFTIDDKVIKGNPKDFLSSGVGHIPEDRSVRGLILDMSIKENLILGYHGLPKFIKKGLFNMEEVKKYSDDLIKEYSIKCPNKDVKASALSGGNQQKIVIARVFSQNPQFVISAQPTRGVDVGAMEYIHSRLLDLRDEGKSILLISADLDEVKTLSDRIAVIYEGEIVAIDKTSNFTDTDLGLLMTGHKSRNVGDDHGKR